MGLESFGLSLKNRFSSRSFFVKKNVYIKEKGLPDRKVIFT